MLHSKFLKGHCATLGVDVPQAVMWSLRRWLPVPGLPQASPWLTCHQLCTPKVWYFLPFP